MGKYRSTVDDHLILPARASLPAGPASFLRQAGQPVPVPVPINLVVDTGSRRTTLVPGVIRRLQLPAADPVRVATALGAGITRFFWVRLEFTEAGLIPFELVKVARLALPPELAQFDGVLGRDLLRQWDSFDYEGRRGRYTVRDVPGPLGWLRRWL